MRQRQPRMSSWPPRPPSVVPGTSSTPPGPPRKRGRGRAQDETSFEDRLLAAVEKQSTSTPVPVPAPTENEHFFKCLIPALERLPLQKQQQVKFEIYRLVYVAGQEVEAAPWTAFKKNNACSINKLKIIKPVSFYHLLTIITSNCFITLIVLRVIYPFRRIYIQILRKL